MPHSAEMQIGRTVMFRRFRSATFSRSSHVPHSHETSRHESHRRGTNHHAPLRRARSHGTAHYELLRYAWHQEMGDRVILRHGSELRVHYRGTCRYG